MTEGTVARIFSERATLDTYLRVEAALAQAEADLEILPQAAAREIAQKATMDLLDLTALREQSERVGYPIAPLVRQLTTLCGEHGRYVHWGATTQDIVNSAFASQVNESLSVFASDLASALEHLAALAREYRKTVMAARTFGGHALPITFGFKVAVWLSGLLRHAERLETLLRRPMDGEFSGVAGTLASLGTKGQQVRRRLMQLLGLSEPIVTWAPMRDAVFERVAFLAGLTATLAKIAGDVSELSSTEIGELEEPLSGGRDTSSALPFKSNPIYCAQVMTSASLVAQHLACVLEATRQHQERSGEGLLEFVAAPQAFVQAERCLTCFRLLIDGLRVYPERMFANLGMTRGVLLAERYMMALAPHLGRLPAHDLVHEACRRAVVQHDDLRTVLANMPETRKHLNPDQLAALSDPKTYLGTALETVDEVLAATRRFLDARGNEIR
ncbi:MAG: adenylosuccinate lyase family protein [Burkholderiales bacterium]